VRAKNEIDERVFAPEGAGRVVLLHHAAADGDDHFRARLFQGPEGPHQRVDLALGMFAHATGIDQEYVGLLRALGAGKAGLRQETRQVLGVVLVHLAAVGLQEIARRLGPVPIIIRNGLELGLPQGVGRVIGSFGHTCPPSIK